MPASVRITVETLVNAPGSHIWMCWTEPKHILKWNQASADWHTTKAETDLREGGAFVSRMEAKDGSAGFDFGGTYTKVIPGKRLEYSMDDGRNVEVLFTEEAGKTRIVETFDAESENPVEMQRGGWQAILDSFRAYAEGQR